MKLNTNHNYHRYTLLNNSVNFIVDSIEFDEGTLITSTGIEILNSEELTIGDYVVIINGNAIKLHTKTNEAKKRVTNLQEAAFK